MALQFILGGSGSGKTTQLHEYLHRESIQNPETQYFVVVPEQFTMETQRELVASSPRGGIMNLEVQSFVRLAYRIFQEQGCGREPVLDDMGKTLVLRRVLASHQDELVYFGKNIHKKGYVAEIKSFLSELLQYGVDQEMLEQMQQSASGKRVLYDKLQDMEVAYQAFREYLEGHYITSEEVLDLLCRQVCHSSLLRGSVLCLDGFTGFTPIQYRLIRELARACRDLVVTVTIDPRENIWKVGEPHKLFYMSRKMIGKLKEIALEEHLEILDPVWAGQEGANRFGEAPGIAHLERSLFRYPVDTFADKPEDITLHVLGDPGLEVGYVVSEILDLLEKGKARYRDIAVVTGNLEVYGLLARQHFERAGLPCFVDQKKGIQTHPFVELLRGLVDLFLSDFSYEKTIRFLRNRYSGFAGEEALDLVDNFLLASGICGWNMWNKPWNVDWALNISEEERTAQVQDSVNELREALIRRLEPLYRLFHDEHTVDAWSNGILDYLREQGYEQTLEQEALDFAEKGDLERAKEYEQVYATACSVYENLAFLLEGEQVVLQEFRDLQETGFEEARVGLIPPGIDQIVVGDISRTRLDHIRYLFFLGVTDDVIPAGNGSGGILSETERLFLSEQFELAPTSREAVYTEQFYLYLLLTKPSGHLYVCYPETGIDGRARRPAYLIDRLRRIFPMLEPVIEENRTDPQALLGEDLGRSHLIHGLRQASERDAGWREIYRYYYGDSESRAWLTGLIDAVFYRESGSRISREAARALYGEMLRGSVSQLERYGACHFAYFLRYGLGLNERLEHAVEFFDIGNVVHDALDRYTKKMLEEGLDWQDVSGQQRDAWADECLMETVDGYKAGLMNSSARSTYMVKRLRRLLHRTIWAVTRQMEAGQFHTVESELRFAHEYGPVKLVGKVDRMDLVEEEQDSYITIVDYKTGSKDLSLARLYQGLQMQLIVYLKSAMDETQRQEDRRKTREKRLILPAGVYYYNIEDPMLDGEEQDEETRERKILEALRMKGMVNEDDPVLGDIDGKFKSDSGELPPGVTSVVGPFKTLKSGKLSAQSKTLTTDEFLDVMEYTTDMIQGMGREILEGDTSINPYVMNQKNACEYCRFGNICRFNLRIPGNEYRRLDNVSDDDALRCMQKCVCGQAPEEPQE